LALGCLSALTILSLRSGADAIAASAKAQKYSYYHGGKLVTLQPSPTYVAVDESRPAGVSFAQALPLKRQPESGRAAFRRHGLGLYRAAQPAGKGAPKLSVASLATVASDNGVIAEPVFEQGPSLLIPGDEVLVGVKPGVSLARTQSLLNGYAQRHGFLSVTVSNGDRLMVRLANPGDGRVFEMSRFINGLPGVRYAEPNMIVHSLQGPASAPQPEGPLPGMLQPGTLRAVKSATPLPPSGPQIQANPTWTTIASTGFESAPAGWGVGTFAGSVDAVPFIVNTRKKSGANSIYMTGGGTQGVAAPGPYPNNVANALYTPNFNISTYEEVYVEFWFWAKYEDPNPSIFDYSYVRVVNTTAGTSSNLAFNVVAFTGDLTSDPTSAGGWRRALARVPPGFRVASAQFQFIFSSDGSVGAEGVYIDDIRIVGTTNVDTEPLGNDPYAGREYELRNVGQIAALGTGNDDLNVPEAWALQTISPSLVLAIVDDGVDLTHPDLNLVTGYNGFDGAVGGGPLDANSFHGTACAGNAGAKRGNAIGVAGTGAGVKIMPVAHGTTYNDLANGINVAVSHGAKILSNSWGWVGAPSQVITDAIDAALAANRVVLFAAGNGPDRPPYTYEVAFPGILTGTRNIITVGASSPTDEHKNASSSDGQNTWGSSYVGAGPDVVAPGPWSYTTDRQGAVGYNTNAATTGVDADYEFQFGGTSSSTPKVAGIVALILSKSPALTPLQVKNLLKSTAADIDTAGVDDRTGSGRVDALAALNALASPVLPGAPTNAAALGFASNRIDVTWKDNFAGETGFEIWASVDGGSFSLLTTVAANIQYYRHSGLTGSHTYAYQVRAYTAAGQTAFSNTATALLLAQPLGLNAQALNSTRIFIKWNDNATNEAVYEIWRKVGAGAFTLRHTAPANTPQFTDNTVVPNQIYAFQVRCRNGAHVSSYSNADTSPAMLAPTNLNGTPVSSTRVNLTWTDNSAALETSFQIFRRIGAGSWKMIGSVGANVTSYADLTTKAGTAYGYQVRAASGNDWSGYSNIRSVTTP
jgi:subtilisin family serine protease